MKKDRIGLATLYMQEMFKILRNYVKADQLDS